MLVSEHLKHDRQHNVCGHLFSGERFPDDVLVVSGFPWLLVSDHLKGHTTFVVSQAKKKKKRAIKSLSLM